MNKNKNYYIPHTVAQDYYCHHSQQSNDGYDGRDGHGGDADDDHDDGVVAGDTDELKVAVVYQRDRHHHRFPLAQQVIVAPRTWYPHGCHC